MRRGATRALSDIRAVAENIPGEERYDSGLRFAEVGGSRLKAGIVGRRDRIYRLFGNTVVDRYA